MRGYNFLPLMILFAMAACGVQENAASGTGATDNPAPIAPAMVYKLDHIEMRKLADGVYQHISQLHTKDFGQVSCNGMVVYQDHDEALVFDSPTDSISASELIYFIEDHLKCRVIGVVPTHFHADCVGGLAAFFRDSIPCYAELRTIAFLEKKGNPFAAKMIPFTDSIDLTVGLQLVRAQYFGPGHTRDNIIAYYPKGKALFGGCLIKALDAGQENLEDADVQAWPRTVRAVEARYPEIQIVIPGHGEPGNMELLRYTESLFQ